MFQGETGYHWPLNAAASSPHFEGQGAIKNQRQGDGLEAHPTKRHDNRYLSSRMRISLNSAHIGAPA
jgi:hypothetical protein